MRTLRLSVAGTVILALLGGLAGVVVAEDERSPASDPPHPVGGTLRLVDQFQGATLIVEERRYLERGYGTYDTIEMDDARLSGTRGTSGTSTPSRAANTAMTARS